jgi:hypothetical protein
MRKLGQPLLDDGRRPRRWRYSSALTVLVGLLFAPVVYESGLLCAARWRAMTGAAPQVKTPVLDALGYAYERARIDVQDFCRPVTGRTTWGSAYMIPFIMVCTVIALLMLRK